MSINTIVVLVLLFFITSIVGVVTGSNSLITVPVMFQFGIDEKTAVATNMFGLTFMAIGASVPFVRQGSIDYRKVAPLAGLTLVGSALGALLVGLITNAGIKLIVSVAMIVVAVFILLNRNKGVEQAQSADELPEVRTRQDSRSPFLTILTFVAVFLLAIYGGLYSGGYITLLTALLVAFFGMNFSESVASTKVINVFSSLIATLIFMYQGLVDYRLGAILAVTMFIGAFIGAHYATKLNDVWLRRIFLSAVFLLAIKTFADLFR